MQVYLEVPNGENLAAALHSKVITVRLIKYAFRSSLPGLSEKWLVTVLNFCFRTASLFCYFSYLFFCLSKPVIYFLLKIVVDYACFMCREFLM